VTITFETKDELDMMMTIIRNVADNRINYPPQHIQAAKSILAEFNNLEVDDHDD
jgi:hypothetical protein